MSEFEKNLSRAFLDLVIENMPGYVFVKDKEHRLVLMNSNFRNLYPEHMRDKILGTTTFEQYDEKEKDAFLEMDRIAFKEGYSETEEKILFPNGETRINLTKKIRFEENGEPFIVGIASDVTELKKVQTQLEGTNDRLNVLIDETKTLADQAFKASKIKDEFIASMSHEIRTPLHGILGYAQLLEDHAQSDEQKEIIETINQCGDDLLKIINEVLDFSKINSGKMVLEEVSMRLSDIISESIMKLSAKAQENSVSIYQLRQPDEFDSFFGGFKQDWSGY